MKEIDFQCAQNTFAIFSSNHKVHFWIQSFNDFYEKMVLKNLGKTVRMSDTNLDQNSSAYFKAVGSRTMGRKFDFVCSVVLILDICRNTFTFVIHDCKRLRCKLGGVNYSILNAKFQNLDMLKYCYNQTLLDPSLF